MRVHYIFSHPLPESFHAAVRDEAIAGLRLAGHDVDLLDLYADGFNPILDAQGRRHYHDTSRNRVGLEDYVARLQGCDALVLQFPTWCFSPPAMMKGYLERVLMPGVAFDIDDPANVKPMLANLKHIVGIVTYGRPRYMALWMGDPPRKIVTRYVKWFARNATTRYHALYHMNVASLAARQSFMQRVHTDMARLRG